MTTGTDSSNDFRKFYTPEAKDYARVVGLRYFVLMVTIFGALALVFFGPIIFLKHLSAHDTFNSLLAVLVGVTMVSAGAGYGTAKRNFLRNCIYACERGGRWRNYAIRREWRIMRRWNLFLALPSFLWMMVLIVYHMFSGKGPDANDWADGLV